MLPRAIELSRWAVELGKRWGHRPSNEAGIAWSLRVGGQRKRWSIQTQCQWLGLWAWPIHQWPCKPPISLPVPFSFLIIILSNFKKERKSKFLKKFENASWSWTIKKVKKKIQIKLELLNDLECCFLGLWSRLGFGLLVSRRWACLDADSRQLWQGIPLPYTYVGGCT